MDPIIVDFGKYRVHFVCNDSTVDFDVYFLDNNNNYISGDQSKSEFYDEHGVLFFIGYVVNVYHKTHDRIIFGDESSLSGTLLLDASNLFHNHILPWCKSKLAN